MAGMLHSCQTLMAIKLRTPPERLSAPVLELEAAGEPAQG
jgi:hypothetical protein